MHIHILMKNQKIQIVGIIEAYKQKVTEEELQNKRINYEEKTQIIDAYNQLREQDKIPYTSLINRIKQGGIPKITIIAPTLEYEKGIPIDVYTLIKAVDNEDGIITIDKNSTVVKTNLKNDEAGTYFVTYEVFDSDKNIGTKTIEITIIADEEDVEIPEIPETPEEEEGEIVPPETDEEDKEEVEEEEFIESIQGAYEDEFGENVEDMNSDEISQEENHIMVKVFVTIIIIAGVTLGIVRKKLKGNKSY